MADALYEKMYETMLTEKEKYVRLPGEQAYIEETIDKYEDMCFKLLANEMLEIKKMAFLNFDHILPGGLDSDGEQTDTYNAQKVEQPFDLFQGYHDFIRDNRDSVCFFSKDDPVAKEEISNYYEYFFYSGCNPKKCSYMKEETLLDIALRVAALFTPVFSSVMVSFQESF